MKPLKFLIFIFLTHLLVFIFSDNSLSYISVGLLFPVILLIILLLTKLPKTLGIIIIILVSAHNIYKITMSQDSLFKVQPNMNLRDEMAVVQKTYEVANGRRFSVNAVTNPYQFPTLWEYLYSTYADKHHLSRPFYRGLTAYAYAGQGSLEKNSARQSYDFLIIEPDVGAKNTWANQAFESEKKGHVIHDTITIGGFIIYEWIPDE